MPDPPIDGFDSDKANLSDTAYAFGTLSLVSLAANIPLAAFGGVNGAEEMSLVPIVIAPKHRSKRLLRAGIFIKCGRRKKPGAATASPALANWGIAWFSFIEAKKALENLSGE